MVGCFNTFEKLGVKESSIIYAGKEAVGLLVSLMAGDEAERGAAVVVVGDVHVAVEAGAKESAIVIWGWPTIVDVVGASIGNVVANPVDDKTADDAGAGARAGVIVLRGADADAISEVEIDWAEGMRLESRDIQQAVLLFSSRRKSMDIKGPPLGGRGVYEILQAELG